MRAYLLLWLLILFAHQATAQVYRSVGINGSVIFSSTPVMNGVTELLPARPTNRIDSLQPSIDPIAPTSLLPERNHPHNHHTALTLIGLPLNQALRANSGTFTVHLATEPPLHPEHRLQWLLDGQPYGPPGTQLHLDLINLDRGEHQLSVTILEGNEMVQQSPTTRFYLQRIHR